MAEYYCPDRISLKAHFVQVGFRPPTNYQGSCPTMGGTRASRSGGSPASGPVKAGSASDRSEAGRRHNGARRAAHLLRLSCTSLDPLLGLVPSLVEGEQPCLASPLDELVWLCYEFCGINPARELCIGRDRVCLGIPCDLGNLGSREGELGAQLPRGVYRWCALKPVG